ncbi:SLC13 family permease [Streptomonospora nanhaiensis]|uniref:SLC13 family permease n=1 Tax=Streptomonospora nanhaiensis TaxID=1323731 RepID=A0ABY6YTA1_9ACTN|nr:SLC13 family permease [Streptomonospora nanhaiensis]WAE75619.1 SLC13 family permease [Streptomonospora nanhaiensis]
MTPQLLTILALLAMFVIATVLPINIGALAFVGAFLVGVLALGMDTDAILGGFPADLFLTLVGVTYLFAIAKNNGTIDLLVRAATRLVGGRVVAIPWIMFGISALLTGVGALSPAAVAIVAPIALGFAVKYRINPLLMGMMVIHGAQGGGFSPVSVYGATVNGIVADSGLAVSPLTLFLGNLVFNLCIALVLFVSLGGNRLVGARAQEFEAAGHAAARTGAAAVSGSGADAVGGSVAVATGGPSGTSAAGAPADPPEDGPAEASADGPAGGPVRFDQLATIAGIVVLGVLALGFGLDVGFVALSVTVVLALISPKAQKNALSQISWPTVLLITGMLTFVGVMESAGTIDYVGDAAASLGAPLLVALVLCYIGAVVSAFASSTAILGATIPLAIPFLMMGEISATGVIVALAVSSTIVDVSPFSTNGALVLANASGVDPDKFYRQILVYSAIVVLVGPMIAWGVLVVPGLL